MNKSKPQNSTWYIAAGYDTEAMQQTIINFKVKVELLVIPSIYTILQYR